MQIRTISYVGVAIIISTVIVSAILNSNFEDEQKIRVAYFPNIGHIVPIVGLEQGSFSDNFDSEIKIERKLFDNGPQVIESIFANSVDIAYVGPGPTINGFLKSENNGIKILAGAASGGASFIVHPDSEIKSIDDFAGKRIAAPQIGNTQDVSLRHLMSEHGLKPAEKGGSVYVLNIANPDIYTLFVKGDIDAAWVAEPWATILVQELGGTRLFYEEDLWPEKQFASVLLIVRSEFLNEHPEIITNWINSHKKTIEWVNDNPNESQIIFNQFLKKTFGKPLPDQIVSEAFSNLEITSDPIAESIHIFASRADSLGYLGRDGYSLQGIFYDSELNAKLVEIDS